VLKKLNVNGADVIFKQLVQRYDFIFFASARINSCNIMGERAYDPCSLFSLRLDDLQLFCL